MTMPSLQSKPEVVPAVHRTILAVELLIISLVLTGCGGRSTTPTGLTSTSMVARRVAVSVSPTNISFGTVNPKSQSIRWLTLTNDENAPVVLQWSYSSPTRAFTLLNAKNPIHINPAETVQLQVEFAPTASADYSGTLMLHAIAGQIPNSAQAIGSRVAPRSIEEQFFRVSLSGHSVHGGGTQNVAIFVSPTSGTVPSGESKQFIATVTGTKENAVSWTAALGSISASGYYTAPTVKSSVVDTISAISVADPTKTGTAFLHIDGNGGGNSGTVTVSVAPNFASIGSGKSMQFTSQVTGTSDSAVTWSAVLGTIDSSGVYRAPSVSTQVVDTVSAISVADPTKYATASMTITPVISRLVNAYYVDPNAGSDSSGNGTASSPWQSICKAFNSGVAGPGGWKIVLQPGSYDVANQLGQGAPCATTDSQGNLRLVTTKGGSSSSLRLAVGGTTAFGIDGARIQGSWYLSGNHTDLSNFEITCPTCGTNLINVGANDVNSTTTGQDMSVRFVYAHDVNTATSGTSCVSGTGDGGTAINVASRVQNAVIDSNIINNVGVNGGCAGQAGTGPLGIYISGPHNKVTNNLISNAQGGIQLNHNVCQELVANNTVVHNYIYGILMAGWDGQAANSECVAGDNNTAIFGNYIAENGFGCGVQNFGNAAEAGGLTMWGIGANSTNDSIGYNYLASNWTNSGSGCTNSPGTANNVIFGGTGYTTPGGNPSTFLGCGPPTCPNSRSQNTNIASSSNAGLVENFQTSVIPTTNPALKGTANFEPLNGGGLVNASNGNSMCVGSPGYNSPCVPTQDILGLARNSASQSIGAYEQ